MLSDADYARYEQFLVKSFVEKSYNAKNCPGNGCEFVAANKTNSPNVDV